MAIMERARTNAEGWSQRLGGRIEGLIGFLSPRLAAERTAYRAAAQELAHAGFTGGFKGSRTSRIRGDIPTGGRQDFHLQVDNARWNGVEIARRLERDSVIAGSLLSRSVENIVGTGFKLQAKARLGKGSKAWNHDVEKLWRDWSQSKDCDVRGLSTMDELLRLTCRARLRDGDQGTILLSDGKLQVVETDQIVSPDRSSTPSKRMVDGVELDRRGRPLAYWVVDDPDPIIGNVRFANEITRIPAESFIFTAKRERHGQTRGIPPLAKIAWLLEQIDGNIEAVTVASRMAACVGLVINREHRASGLKRDEDGRRRTKMQPGFQMEIGLKDKVTQIDQNQPGTDWPDYLASLFRLVGLEFGLPLEIGFLDVSRANYTNLRAACNQAKRTWRIEQQELMRWLDAIYRWKVLNWIRAGLLAPRRDAFEADWITPGWDWVDPQKEIAATLAAIDAGIETKGRVSRMRGLDLEDIIADRKQELADFKAAGIPEVASKITRDPGAGDGGEPEPQGEDDDA